MINMTPQYSTIKFTDVWEDAASFESDFAASPFGGTSPAITVGNQEKLYYLLYARFGNSPIANRDVTQFKFKVYSVIFQYGPTWEKRLEIQATLRSLTPETGLFDGATSIYNHAFNPNTEPSTDTSDPLPYINDQNTSKYKKNQLEAYAELWDLLRVDVTEVFLSQFKPLFKTFVSPEAPLIYIDEEDE